MASEDAASTSAGPDTAIQVCVRVRPLNDRERDEGHRVCISFDDPTKQVVLTAVDKNTLLQLRGATAKGYAFDRRYGQDDTSDIIYEDAVNQLVENCFKGYNGTVLAYGQTGSGKTHTMAGGVGIHGRREEGVIPRVISHIFQIVESIKKKHKPGEKIAISACALELYNEDLVDLSIKVKDDSKGWDGVKQQGTLKLQERPVGKDGRVVPEVIGVRELTVTTSEELLKFFSECMENRSTSSTKLNDRSSRSHAIFTVTIHRTIVEVLNELGDDFKAKVRSSEFQSKLHLVDLAGSERVKRSGVTGKELKEATHINSGLLALGNVIVALATESDNKGGKKGHIPYRDSKLTRLLQDSLGGNSLTVLISCVSPSEMDFEESNNTLKYANRACHIKNTPLPNKFNVLEEDLLPTIPRGAPGLGMVQLQTLLAEHEHIKEIRERKDKERKEKEERRQAQLAAMKEEALKTKGFQRLRANQYDELRRQVAGSKGTNIPADQVIESEIIKGFGRMRMAQSVDSLPQTPYSRARVGSGRTSTAKGSNDSSPHGTPRRPAGAVAQSVHAKSTSSKPGQSFADWLAAQQAADEAAATGASSDDFFEQEGEGDGNADAHDFILEGDEAESGAGGIEDVIVEESGEEAAAAASDGGAKEDTASFIVDDDAAGAAGAGQASMVSKSKFRRGGKRAEAGPAEGGEGEGGMVASESMGAISTEAEALPEEVEPGPEAAEAEVFDPIQDDMVPKLLARFRVNTSDTLSVFKATTKEDFRDVISLLPENTPLPASDKMTYLLARLEVSPGKDISSGLAKVAAGELTMNEAVGPAVGCLMATFGTNMISSCIFEFEDPADLRFYGVDERIELWGLQIPHNSVRPLLTEVAEGIAEGGAEATPSKDKDVITWSSVDRLNMSIGLLYALCNHALDSGIRCGFCVPRPQLLRRWVQAGVKMNAIKTQLKLIYPPTAHDYEYYKASTVAYFMVSEVRGALEKVLGILPSD